MKLLKIVLIVSFVAAALGQTRKQITEPCNGKRLVKDGDIVAGPNCLYSYALPYTADEKITSVRIVEHSVFLHDGTLFSTKPLSSVRDVRSLGYTLKPTKLCHECGDLVKWELLDCIAPTWPNSQLPKECK